MNQAPTKQQPTAELIGVSKTFTNDSGDSVKALADLNLTINQGEFVTIVGATGCGKTTLLNVIAGLESVDSGSVRLADGVRFGKNATCVFQHYTLFPWRSVLRNVTFGLQMRGVPRRKRNHTARTLLDQLGLQGFERARPSELSGGMRQRAAIAQSLAIQPTLLLMDEPFGALDESTRRDLQSMLIDIWQSTRITIIFVTHSIDEALTLGGRVLVFSQRPGRVTAELPVTLPRPRDRLSKGFAALFMDIRQTLTTANNQITSNATE